MRILIVSDAWTPQVNGVVRTIQSTVEILERMGHTVEVIGPDRFRSFPCPTYPEIRLALAARRRLRTLADAFRPDAVHVATEGPLGWSARRLCMRRGWKFTTSFHTQFPEYVNIRTGLPLDWTYAVMRRFHRPAAAVMVATPTLRANLEAQGFVNLVDWSRGVDTDLFRPEARIPLELPRPVMTYVGRVAPEKNIEAFLRLERPGTKLVIGDGPALPSLKQRYPKAVFVGPRYGEELAGHYAASDVLVFPSRTDTFGLVILEALACGVPVAAFPVQGPIDVLAGTGAGALDEDLGHAVDRALAIDREVARRTAIDRSWEACTRQFLLHVNRFR